MEVSSDFHPFLMRREMLFMVIEMPLVESSSAKIDFTKDITSSVNLSKVGDSLQTHHSLCRESNDALQ